MLLRLLSDVAAGFVGAVSAPHVMKLAKDLFKRLSPDGRLAALEAKAAKLKTRLEVAAVQVETDVATEWADLKAEATKVEAQVGKAV